MLKLLHEAPQRPDTRAVAAAALVRVRANAAAERKALWRLLRRAGHLPASQLLLVFRVLWYVKLASRG